jgi:hypothetical protein
MTVFSFINPIYRNLERNDGLADDIYNEIEMLG